MGNSLQDQLLKTGAISKLKAQKANSENRKRLKQKQKNKKSASIVDKDQENIRLAQEHKVARDKELNRQKQAEIQQKAVAAQISQLIELNRLSRDEGEQPYNFLDGKNVRKIYVDNTMLTHLGNGLLSIVKTSEGYEVVATVVADKIKERDGDVVIPLNQSESIVEGDDPYADYRVPDDLMW